MAPVFVSAHSRRGRRALSSGFVLSSSDIETVVQHGDTVYVVVDKPADYPAAVKGFRWPWQLVFLISLLVSLVGCLGLLVGAWVW